MDKCKRKRTYYFNDEWEHLYCFVDYKGKCICLLCNNSVAIPKKSNIERHFKTVHTNFDSDYPMNSEIRRKKIISLKSSITNQQSFFTKPLQQHKAATIASYKISHLLAKNKKPFTDGELVKEAMLEAADSLFEEFKNKKEIVSAINTLQLSARTVTRRIEVIAENLEAELANDMENCIFFSLQMDESTDVTNISQLAICVKMVFSDFTTKEEFLKVLPLKGSTRGEDIFSTFKKYITDVKLPVQKLSSITTDGAPAMTGKKKGFIALCRQDSLFPKFISYHCLIHQEMLCAKTIGFQHVFTIVTKIINSIRSGAMQHRLFKLLLEDEDVQFTDLLLHTEVRWLSRGKILERFIMLLPQIKEFIASRGEFYEQLENKDWLIDLGFLTDITAKLNELNLKIQGKNQHIADMISAVNAFKCKLVLLKSHLLKKSLSHFPNIKYTVESLNLNNENFTATSYLEIIDKLIEEFSSRFEDFAALEPVLRFFINPFNVTEDDVLEIVSVYFELHNIEDLELEIINLQSDIILKAHSNDKMFWNLVDENKYPILRKCALKIYSYCATTYNCESLFSNMKYLKSKYRTKLNDSHLDNCLRTGNSKYIPNYKKLAENMDTQVSH